MTSLLHALTSIGIGLAALALGAVPGAASTLTFDFSGEVSHVDPVATGLGIQLGDQLTGLVTYDPANTTSYTQTSEYHMPTANTFAQSAGSFSFSVAHPGGTVFYTHTTSGSGSVASQNYLGLFTGFYLALDGSDADLGVGFGTCCSDTLLTSLTGLSPNLGNVAATLGGNDIYSSGGNIYLAPGLQGLEFTLSLTPTPIPASASLFISALGGLGLIGWTRRRAAAISAAA